MMTMMVLWWWWCVPRRDHCCARLFTMLNCYRHTMVAMGLGVCWNEVLPAPVSPTIKTDTDRQKERILIINFHIKSNYLRNNDFIFIYSIAYWWECHLCERMRDKNDTIFSTTMTMPTIRTSLQSEQRNSKIQPHQRDAVHHICTI